MFKETYPHYQCLQTEEFQNLVDELIVYLAPTLLGSEAKPMFELPFSQMVQQQRLTMRDMRMIGQDIRLTYHMV